MERAHVKKSVRQIDENSWIIDDKIIISRAPPSENSTWKDSADWDYTVTTAPSQPPASQPLPEDGDGDDSTVKMVYWAGEASAVYSIGDQAFCKVRNLDFPRVTREHVTLAWMHARSWGFTLPNTLYHAEHDGRYYHFLSRVPGKTIDSLWESVDDATRNEYVDKVVGVCKEMRDTAAPAGHNAITGVDGNHLSEFYLSDRDRDICPETLKESCIEMGMDCSSRGKFVFYHTDMGPTNLLIDPETGGISVIDWETAGFLPVEWIRTKYRMSSGMDLSSGNGFEFRKRVQLRLGEQGFADVADGFVAHSEKSRRAWEEKQKKEREEQEQKERQKAQKN